MTVSSFVPRATQRALLAFAALAGVGCADSLPTGPESSRLATAPQLAASTSTELFISEYIEGSSNNKAIEIYNPGASAVNLATAGYSIQMFFNGSASAGLTINLTGTIAAGGTFVLAQASSNATILAAAQQTNGAGWFNGDDAVVLRKGTTVIDVFGQVGFDPGTEWGTGLQSTADNTLRRKSTVCVGDIDGSNAFAPATEWDGYANDTFNGLGSHTADCASAPPTVPAVQSTTPVNGATDAPLSGQLSVTFNTPVSLAPSWYSVSCTESGARSATVTGGPSAYALDIDGDLSNGEQCTVTILASGVSNAAAPSVKLASDFSFSFTALNSCTLEFTAPSAIQGSGSTTPLAGQVISTQGVVVGDFEGTSGATLRGFYLQALTGDGDPSTSDAVFVFNGNPSGNVSLGDVVRVTGTAAEFQGQTQVSATTITKCGQTATVEPVEVSLPLTSADDLERFEGMLVRLSQTLTVTEHFQLGRFGQVVLSSGGRLPQPTEIAAPGAAAEAVAAANALNRIIVDDASQSQNPDPIPFGRGGNPLSAINTLRGGDEVSGIVGVMTYTWAGASASGNAYRVRPISALGGVVPSFNATNARPMSAPMVGGDIRVASANLLNYFNSFSGCRNGVNGALTDCRGADNATEFARQKAKTIAALRALDADIIGVIEVENDGYGTSSALADLVNGLNAEVGAGSYAFIDADAGTGQTNALGTDAIKVGLLYRPARVTPTGITAALNSDAFVNGGDAAPRNRPVLLQAFQTAARGRVVVGVTHLKSKGSDCDAPDAGDGQGNCNLVRRRSVEELQAWLATDPTDTGEEDVLLVGDFNSYAQEDPITALTATGFRNLVKEFGGAGTYSYAFDGQWGSLDHAIASASLFTQATGAADFHINADEPSVLDYNTDFKTVGLQASLYAPDAFRAADHDPLLVGLQLNAPAVTYNFSGLLAPYRRARGMSKENSGRTIPLRFSLGGDYGLDIFQAGWPASRAISCTTGEALGAWETIDTAGSSSLSVSAEGTYHFNWQTDESWAGSCRALRFRFADESQQTIRFDFR